MFEGEKVGLNSIEATGTIRCPKGIMVVTVNENSPAAALVMESLEMSYSKASTQAKLGEQLAKYGRYFDVLEYLNLYKGHDL